MNLSSLENEIKYLKNNCDVIFVPKNAATWRQKAKFEKFANNILDRMLDLIAMAKDIERERNGSNPN